MLLQTLAVPMVGLLMLLLTAVTVASAIEVVEAGQPQALLVLGEVRAVLQPGLNVVPPFVSTTYPIDVESGTIQTDGTPIELPDELAEELDSGLTTGS